MFKKLFIACAAVGAVALAVHAASPRYVTKSANGNTANGAWVAFPADPSSHIRIVTANWSADTNNAALSFKSGLGAYSVAATASAATNNTIVINSTVGLAANDLVLLQRSGVCYTNTVVSTNSVTNLVISVGGFGVVATAGDSIYKMSSATTLPVGNTTNWQSGAAIYAATYSGRPVLVQLTPCNVTNKLNSVVATYD